MSETEIVIDLESMIKGFWSPEDIEYDDIKVILNEAPEKPDYPMILYRRSLGKGAASQANPFTFNITKYIDRYEIVCSTKPVQGETTITEAKTQRDGMIKQVRRIIVQNPRFIDGKTIRPRREYDPVKSKREENVITTIAEVDVVSYRSRTDD